MARAPTAAKAHPTPSAINAARAQDRRVTAYLPGWYSPYRKPPSSSRVTGTTSIALRSCDYTKLILTPPPRLQCSKIGA